MAIQFLPEKEALRILADLQDTPPPKVEELPCPECSRPTVSDPIARALGRKAHWCPFCQQNVAG